MTPTPAKKGKCTLCKTTFRARAISERYCDKCSPFKNNLGQHHRKGRGLTRYLVRARDGFKCRDCGKRRTPAMVENYNRFCVGLAGRKKLFDIHHIDGMCGKNSRGYDSVKTVNTLITLCHSCHYRRHDFSKRVSGEWEKFGQMIGVV